MANKIEQLAENDLDKLIELALQDVTKDLSKIAVWIIDRSPKWRSEGYSVIKSEVEKRLSK